MLAGKYVIVALAILVRITKISYISFLFSQFQQKYREVPKKKQKYSPIWKFSSSSIYVLKWCFVSATVKSHCFTNPYVSRTWIWKHTIFSTKNIVTKSKKLPSGTFNSFHATDLFLCFLKTPKNLCFFIISGGIERDQWHEMSWRKFFPSKTKNEKKKKTFFQVKVKRNCLKMC